ncbi:MAG: diguanylate cyclase [Magnetospirillum sp.]|nr:diguanylate cyclase [Magnetospirillum sp.]
MKTMSDRQRPRGSVAVELGAAALAAYPGQAVVLDRQGRVVATNEHAEPLATAIAEGRLDNLAELLSSGGAAGVVETLPLAGGGRLIIELSALPAADGRVLVLGRDVTLERNLRSALVESRQRYKDLVEISSDFAWEVGPDGRFAFVSPKGALGYTADELVGRRPQDYVVEQGESQGAAQLFSAAMAMEDTEVWMRLADGSQACLLTSSTPLRGDGGDWRGARGVCRDITQERLRDAALSRANNRERLLSYIVRTIRDEVDPADMLKAAAASTAKALGATGCRIFRILPDGLDFALAAQYGEAGEETGLLDNFLATDHIEQDVDGWHLLATVSRYRHSINGAICLWRAPVRPGWSDDDRLLVDDVSNQVGLACEQIANHERILKLSRTDGLTGLFNRRAFFEEIARRFQRLSHEGKPAALIYADLDNFKLVNDVHGHQTGDEALLAVRDLLLQYTRPVDLVARLGGDEFAIWLENAEEPTAVTRCHDLLSASRGLDRFSGTPEKPLHMSLGVAVHNGNTGETLEDVIARADKAMYEVKRDGKGSYRLAPPPGGATAP